MTEFARYTGELFGRLEEETGQATGFRRNGALRVATTDARYEELARGASMGRNFGLPVEALSPGQIAERWPDINTNGIVGGFWFPQDGQVNPADVTMAYAKGARMTGARLFENLAVTQILVENGRAAGVLTEQGKIESRIVVICGGMWSRDLAASVGVSIPLHAAEHFYVVTEAIPGLPRNLPLLFLTDEWTYYKEDAGKLLVGFFEPVAKPWGQEGISENFCFDALPQDVDHIAPHLDTAARRVPLLEKVGVQLFFNGPESFTPDNRYLLGETPEVPGLFCATGFNSLGILSSGGAGKALASWIRDGRPPVELNDVDVRRTQSFQRNRRYLEHRTVESLGLNFDMHWPSRQFATARSVRRSPIHDRLVSAGAWMTEQSGWERPGFFGEPDDIRNVSYSYHRPSWFENVAVECRNTAENVTVFDHTCFSKYRVEGPDALGVLNVVSANNCDVGIGRVVYTQWLNEAGGIEADLTVTRLSENAFLVVTGAASQRRDLTWLKRHTPENARVYIADITSGLAMFTLMGPRTRDLLARLSPDDFSNEGFPFGTSREIDLGYARVRASRLTYVGELGFEIYMETEFAAHVHDAIVQVGHEFGLMHGGFFALNSLRMEKGYRHWGHDVGEEDTPYEGGLGFAVAIDKPGGFIGREALLQQTAKGAIARRLAHIKLPGDAAAPMLHHDEPILLNGEIVGSVTSGAYGHRVGASLGLGYVTNSEGVTADWLSSGRWEVEVAMKRYPAELQLAAWYDPKNVRIRS